MRIGAAVQRAGGLLAGIVIATKVDPAADSTEIPDGRVRASIAKGLARLGVDRTGPDVQRRYPHGERDDRVAVAGPAVGAACARYDQPLAAAALQCSMPSGDVESTVVGVSSPERIAQMVEHASMTIPVELRAELLTLVPPADGWLDQPA